MWCDETPRVLRFYCDWCRKRTKHYATVTLHDCGLTGYTRHDEVCKKCFDSAGYKKNSHLVQLVKA